VGTIYLIRHGQAAFGTDDYDRLTALGTSQCRHLGEYFARRKIHINVVWRGSLTRHRQSLDAILEGYGAARSALLAQACEVFPELNEYDPEAVVDALNGARLGPHEAAEARDPHVVRQHFRVLRDALVAWAEARTEPRGMASFAQFQSAAHDVLRQARERFTDGNVVIVSSGGPIGAMVAATLQAPAAIAVDLNLRIRNASLTEFATSSRRHHLVAFNGIAHLEDKVDCVTYA